jgi:pyruvate ferredoxin oxidoreductase gamma subunit
VFQARIHGRGGQGVVTAAELLSVAAFRDGQFAQAFPSFGSERTGAPVVAFCRIDAAPIRTREPIVDPDGLIVQDPTLVHQVDLFSGVRPEGFILVNSARSFADLGLGDLVRRHGDERLVTVPATELALEHTGRPFPNAVLLGAFAALSGAVSLESVVLAIGDRFNREVADANARATTDAYHHVLRVMAHRKGALTVAQAD